MLPLFITSGLLAVLLGSSPPAALPPVRGLPSTDKFPVVPNNGEVNKDNGILITPPKIRIFGIGVGFEKTGTLQGIPLSTVLSGAPAARAGLTVGCVVAEINGVSTVGRSAEDCVRMVQESPTNTVTLRYFDAALTEHRVTLEKEFIDVPS